MYKVTVKQYGWFVEYSANIGNKTVYLTLAGKDSTDKRKRLKAYLDMAKRHYNNDNPHQKSDNTSQGTPKSIESNQSSNIFDSKNIDF